MFLGVLVIAPKHRISNIEQGISNNEVWNRKAQGVAHGYAQSSYLLNIKNDRIPYFDIPCSIFCGSKQTRKLGFLLKSYAVLRHCNLKQLLYHIK